VIPILLLVRRLTTYAAIAAGMLGAVLALVGCAIAAVAGSAPSPGLLAAIVIGAGLAAALAARIVLRRIPWFGVALYAFRRISARLSRTKGSRGS
jgi:hypothetical protein